jgi:hypothetical protein
MYVMGWMLGETYDGLKYEVQDIEDYIKHY